MRTETEDRVIVLAQYIVKNSATVREAAAWSGISKSTVHSDVTKRLYAKDPALYEQVRTVLDENKAERHLRGGMATREKWQKSRRSSMTSLKVPHSPKRCIALLNLNKNEDSHSMQDPVSDSDFYNAE